MLLLTLLHKKLMKVIPNYKDAFMRLFLFLFSKLDEIRIVISSEIVSPVSSGLITLECMTVDGLQG